jgi:hypothetical protein
MQIVNNKVDPSLKTRDKKSLKKKNKAEVQMAKKKVIERL